MPVVAAPSPNPPGPVPKKTASAAAASTPPQAVAAESKPAELGGPKGADPTRFGDWERAGRCIDF